MGEADRDPPPGASKKEKPSFFFYFFFFSFFQRFIQTLPFELLLLLPLVLLPS
jgi:hypothetical protein